MHREGSQHRGVRSALCVLAGSLLLAGSLPLAAVGCADEGGTSAGGGGSSSGSGSGSSSGVGWTEPEPVEESCGDGTDEDRNGQVDEGCICGPVGQSQGCFLGPPRSRGVGDCADGAQQCEGEGEFPSWSACLGDAGPQNEACGGGDENCNGAVDEGCPCPDSSATRPCYPGPPEEQTRGLCYAGRQSCRDEGAGEVWSLCEGAGEPSPERCDDGFDDDCDGEIDEGCECVADTTQPCYPGPRAQVGTGICVAGTQTCLTDPRGGTAWGPCEGATAPTEEQCADGVDQDCDGVDPECPPVIDADIDVDGDCLRICCPDSHPHPVGCDLAFDGDDPRGCVAFTPGNNCVYLQEGDVCGAGRVRGSLRCSTAPQGDLDAGNCAINKQDRIYGQRRADCPDTE